MGIEKGGNAQIKGPQQVDKASVTAWLAKMRDMRVKCQKSIGFNGSAFEIPALKWTQTSYYQPQMHPYDRYFFDPSLGNGTNGSGYTVNRWLADLNTRFGGIDSALLWPVYTNLGIDDRSQFDMIRSLPGGVEGLKVVVKQLHDANVKVLWAYNKWDYSTKGQEHAGGNTQGLGTDPMNLAKVMRDTDADGFNGDTMGEIPQAFQEAATSIYKPVAMEAEGGLANLADMNYNTIGWAEGFEASEPGAVDDMPDVDKPKWVSGGKAMSNWSDRYSGSPESADEYGGTDKIRPLQVAWFNGVGFETWENIWGVWNRILDRDAEALRRVGILLRFFGQRGFLQSADWVPHTAEVLTMAQGVFGSAFPSPAGDEVLYTLVNRRATPLTTAHLLPEERHPTRSHSSSGSSRRAAAMRYYDCYHGVELHPDPSTGELSFEILGHDFGCVIATQNTTGAGTNLAPIDEAELRGDGMVQPPSLGPLLQAMAALTKQPLSSFAADWKGNCLEQQLVSPIGKTPLRPLHNGSATEVYVPGAVFNFQCSCVQIEGAAGSGVGVQWPWESLPQRHHNHTLKIDAMYVDKHPVTNAEYAQYLAESGYEPADSAHWLEQNFEPAASTKTETTNAPRKPRAGWEDRPVTYVGLADAKAFCAFYKKRLPHAYEWQYVAQSTDGRRYPWGDIYDPARVPAISNNYTNPGPEPVGKYPQGASPFGVEDLVGSVWQYTTEFQDDHTRAVILRGGSNYGPWRGLASNAVPGSYDPSTGKNLSHSAGGSHWYFRPAFRNDNYNKYFVMSGSYERAGTLGFRCVADAVDDCGTEGRLCVSALRLDEDEGDGEVDGEGKGKGNGSDASGGLNLTRGWRTLPVPAPSPAGANSHGAAHANGAAATELTAPAPPTAGTHATLRLQLSSSMGAHGNLTATVGFSSPPSSSSSSSSPPPPPSSVHVTVTPDIRSLSLRYTDGPLRVRYSTLLSTNSNRSSNSNGVCANPRLCLLSTAETCPYGLSMVRCVTNLSRPAAIDWAHWGTLFTHNNTEVSQHEWFTNRKAGGPALLQPTLELPDGKGTDLKTWGGQFWPSDRAVFSWTGGTPTESAGDADWWAAKPTPSPRAGVTSTAGSFKMVVPKQPGPRKLTLYLGLGNFGGAVGNSAVLRLSSPGQPDVTKVIEHDYGANNNWRNTACTIVFDGELTVTWALGPCSPLYNRACGLLGWQAAVLEEWAGGPGGGVAIRAAELLVV